MARYKTATDAMVFGCFRRAGEEFTGPAWEDAHPWPMPKHLTRIDAEPAAQEEADPGNADEDSESSDQEGPLDLPSENADVEAVQAPGETPAETAVQDDAEPAEKKPAPGRRGRPREKA